MSMVLGVPIFVFAGFAWAFGAFQGWLKVIPCPPPPAATQVGISLAGGAASALLEAPLGRRLGAVPPGRLPERKIVFQSSPVNFHDCWREGTPPSPPNSPEAKCRGNLRVTFHARQWEMGVACPSTPACGHGSKASKSLRLGHTVDGRNPASFCKA